MAALQERNGSYRLIFRYHGKQHTFTLGTIGQDEAQAKAGAVDLLLLRLKQRLVAVPPGVSIEDFLFHEGEVKQLEEVSAVEPMTLRQFKDKYLEVSGG